MSKILLPDLSALAPRRRWLLLTAISLGLIVLLRLVHAPAYMLLGAIIGGVFMATSGAGVTLPQSGFSVAQAVVGAVVATSITRDSVAGIAENGLLFLLMVLSVSLVASGLGYLLARTRTLPGSTAIWGMSPGAALTMVVMSEAYGADSRLVAFMQYLRVIMVTFSATIAGYLWRDGYGPAAAAATGTGGAASAETYGLDFFLTLTLCLAAAAFAHVRRMPLFAMIGPLILCSALNLTGVITVTLPFWLTVVAYIAVGWNIGLRFNRPILIYAFHALPRIVLAILAMIAICGLMSVAFSHVAGIDPMSAFLATSPGGIDSVAIIAASVGGNVSLVMAVQTIRLIVVMLTGPALAAFVARRTGWERVGSEGGGPGQNH